LRLRVPQPGHLGQHQAEVAPTSALDISSLPLVELWESDFEMGANSLSAARQESD
jgi:hypothetical protein